MIRPFIVLVAAFALLGARNDLEAQRVAVDLRAVAATPTQRLAGTDLSAGFGYGLTVGYHLQPHLLAYGGWDWMHFQAEQSFAGTDMDFEETGYTGGCASSTRSVDRRPRCSVSRPVRRTSTSRSRTSAETSWRTRATSSASRPAAGS